MKKVVLLLLVVLMSVTGLNSFGQSAQKKKTTKTKTHVTKKQNPKTKKQTPKKQINKTPKKNLAKKKAVNHKASLCGSGGSCIRQNKKADADNLSRIANDKKLASMKKNGYLVPICNTVKCDPRLDEKLRCCRPWTNAFLKDIGTAFAAKFKKKLQINSAVRTVEHQECLRKRNGNAAKTKGPKASSHLTGATVDIAKKGLSKAQIVWLRQYLLRLERQKLIEATEEYAQLVFHVMVFKNYRSRTST